MLKQELKVISTQHQIDCASVPKAGSENHGNVEKPKPGNTTLSRETRPGINLTALPRVHLRMDVHM